MGAVHVRTPKNFVLEERLERYADAIETNPEALLMCDKEVIEV